MSYAAMYSASILDEAKVFCNVDVHEIGPFAKHIMDPVLDLLVSRSPPKSQSDQPSGLNWSSEY